MIRLYVDAPLSAGQTLTLSDDHFHYLAHVMRRTIGDEVCLFNGKNGEWSARIATLTKRTGTLAISAQTRSQTTEPRLILCPALIKKENMDWIFQKATEIGVSDIFPLLTERTVVPRLNLDRAIATVREAAEQSERLTVPVIHTPTRLPDFLAQTAKDFIPVCLSERGTTTAPLTQDQPYAFCIGPEGGWTPAEQELFTRHHAIFWHLGTTILRAETAAITALACYHFHS